MPALQTLGKYEIRRQLGRGAMGIVYEGFDPVIERTVAIKTVRLPEVSDAETADEITRFRREARAAGRLTHPNIVGIFDYGETEGIAFIVMEYVNGTTLKSLLDRHESFPLATIVRIMDDLLTGLQFSHERGVVHRDIKPANLMLTRSGQAKIADFGIARIESSSMTQTGTVIGTPAYMSPEQFMGQVVDARSDIYSAGVLLYQLLTGERPFEGGMASIMEKALHTDAPLPSQRSVTAPRRFDAVIQRAMAKRPEDRFASAKDFADAIRDAVAAPAPPAVAEPDESDDTATVLAARHVELPAQYTARSSEPPDTTVPRHEAATVTDSLTLPPLSRPRRKAAARPRPVPIFLGVGVASLAVLGGVGFYLLSGDRTATSTRPDAPGQSVAALPVPPLATAPPPPPAAATTPPPSVAATTPPLPAAATTPAPPATDPGQAVALAPGPALPSVSQPPAIIPPIANPPPLVPTPPSAPTALVAPAPVTVPPMSSPPERLRAAARSVPCAALSVTSDAGFLRISGFARRGPELDRLLTAAQADHVTANITHVDQFACPQITAVAALARQTWEASPRPLTVRADRREPVSGTHFKIEAETNLAVVYVDLYQSDGSVRHLMQPMPTVQSNPHTASVIAPSPGAGLIVALGSATPIDLGARPETESASDYLAALQPALNDATALRAADLAWVTVRPEAPVVKPRPVESATVKVPPPNPPVLRSSRCSNIVSRAQLGETLSNAEITALRTECRS